MKVLVCLGHVPDTTTKVRFTDGNTRFDQNGVQWVINPWDELALTRAIELQEDGSNPVAEVVVITAGDISSEPTIRKALAIGADRGVRIDLAPADANDVARNIAEYVKSNPFDLILCGIESSDYNGSAVGAMLAEYLGFHSISGVSGIAFENQQIIITRDIDGGHETLETGLPLVAIVQKGIAKEPRIPAMRGIMMARKKPLDTIAALAPMGMTEMVSYELPSPKPPCKMVDAAHVKELVLLLQNEAKVL